jgi:hypothetical protein
MRHVCRATVQSTVHGSTLVARGRSVVDCHVLITQNLGSGLCGRARLEYAISEATMVVGQLMNGQVGTPANPRNPYPRNACLSRENEAHTLSSLGWTQAGKCQCSTKKQTPARQRKIMPVQKFPTVFPAIWGCRWVPQCSTRLL